jgi:hypothetical protein
MTAEVPDAIEPSEYEALLDRACPVPRCGLRIRDHSPEQATACLERWLAALDEREVPR